LLNTLQVAVKSKLNPGDISFQGLLILELALVEQTFSLIIDSGNGNLSFAHLLAKILLSEFKYGLFE
jgi:hypothetical protein